MKTPALDDLIDAAAVLRGEQVDDPTAATRVSIWLRQYAREIEERRAAREAQVSVKYLRFTRAEDDHKNPPPAPRAEGTKS